MSRQGWAEYRLERTVVVLATVVLILILLLNAPLHYTERGVPAHLVQQRFLQSLTLLRGQWLLHGQPQFVDWRSPSGESYQVKMSKARGWPQPDRDCRMLWHQLMGKPAEALLAWQQFQRDYCRFRLLDGADLRYYPDTGSVIVYESRK